MKKSFLSNLTVILLFLFVPYALTMLINGVNMALLNRAFDVETILPVVVAAQIDSDHEMENIKAQVIIARSNFYRKIQEQKSIRQIFDEVREEWNEDIQNNVCSFIRSGNKYEKATAETTGKVLVLEDKLKLIPYHEISAGETRNGKEVLHSAEYAYLKSVNSSADKDSEDFWYSVYIDQSILPENLSIETRDSAGYVTELLSDKTILEGESFRKGIGLPSANFTMKKIGNEIRFLCKGRGHGLGFSQYGGNVLAKQHKTGEEILAYYFPEMEIVNVKEILL